MEDLYSLLHKLSAAETQVVKNYLTCFSSHKGSDDSKSVKLFDLQLKSTKPLTLDECSKVIYGKSEYENIVKLKNRLKEKIFDALITDVNTERREKLDEADRAVVIVKKKLAQFQQLLYSVGNHSIVQELLNEIICISKEYEHYTGVCEGLKFRKFLSGITQGEKCFLDFNKELRKYEYYNSAVGKSNDYYYRLMIKSEFTSEKDKKDLEKFLKDSIAELRKDSEYTKSKVVLYYQKYLEFAFYNLKENYSKARSVCLELINIIRDNKAVFRKQRIGIVYKNLSHCEIYMNDFANAVQSARHAQSFLINDSLNLSSAQEQEFYALFYSKQYEQAQKISEELVRGVPKELGDFRYAKYCYLNACALFALKKYYTAQSILSQNMELSRDKTGWELGIRMLSIMTDVELLNHDEAGLKVHSLRKQIDRLSKTHAVSERNRFISKYLTLLEGKGFMFVSMNGKTDSILEKLSSKDLKHRWAILSPELIPFHQWVGAKKGSKVKVSVKVKERKEKVLAVR